MNLTFIGFYFLYSENLKKSKRAHKELKNYRMYSFDHDIINQTNLVCQEE